MIKWTKPDWEHTPNTRLEPRWRCRLQRKAVVDRSISHILGGRDDHDSTQEEGASRSGPTNAEGLWTSLTTCGASPWLIRAPENALRQSSREPLVGCDRDEGSHTNGKEFKPKLCHAPYIRSQMHPRIDAKAPMRSKVSIFALRNVPLKPPRTTSFLAGGCVFGQTPKWQPKLA